jgi:hypothetical protein
MRDRRKAPHFKCRWWSEGPLIILGTGPWATISYARSRLSAALGVVALTTTLGSNGARCAQRNCHEENYLGVECEF